MLNKMQYLEGIGKIANMTNTTPPEGIGLWYKHFSHWGKNDWDTACEACGTELKWFPKLAEIKERKPKYYSTGAVKRASNWLMKNEPVGLRGSDELENKIDNLNNEELKWLFNKGGCEVGVDEFLIVQFKKNRNHILYREFIRNELRNVLKAKKENHNESI